MVRTPEMVKNLPGGSVGFEMSARPDPSHRALDGWVLTSFASASRGNYYYLLSLRSRSVLDRNGFIKFGIPFLVPQPASLSGSVSSVAYSPTGAHIASGSIDDTIQVWDAMPGAPIGASRYEGVNPVAISSDSAHIISGCNDGTVRMWDVLLGTLIGTLFERFSGYTCTTSVSHSRWHPHSFGFFGPHSSNAWCRVRDAYSFGWPLHHLRLSSQDDSDMERCVWSTDWQPSRGTF